MKSSEQYVIAIDAGTTTLAASLIELASGRRLASHSARNPQGAFGADVVSRLAYACASEENIRRLGTLLNEGVYSLVQEVLTEAAVTLESVTSIALAGNPAMEHLLLGLPVASLAFPPYRPMFNAGRTVNTSDLGWSIEAEVYLFPLPGGFVGGDLVAYLYGQASPASHPPVPVSRLFLDIGTNAEIALITDSTVFATSAAAGPALEGGNLSCGMTASEGAISDVRIEGDRITCEVIGGGAPRGICGSGVIALVAELLRCGVLDASGRLLSPGEIPSNLGNRLQEVNGQKAFFLYRDAERIVSLTQEDIRQFQLATAAIRAGIEVLIAWSQASYDKFQEVLLTGSFGAMLEPDHLLAVGILADKILPKVHFISDGVLQGVEKMLRSPVGEAEVEHFAKSVKVVPLSGNPLFEKYFLKCLEFPANGE